MISKILFEIPAAFDMAVKGGQLVQIGGLLKDATTGRIVAHLQESGLAHSLISNALLGSTSPAGLALSAVSQAVSVGTGVYTSIQVNQIKSMIEGLQSLQIATLGVSLLGVGVSAGSFIYMRKRFNAVDKRIDTLLETVISKFDDQRKSTLRSHLSQVTGLVQQANQAHTLANPTKEYSRVAECLAAQAAHFEGELTFLITTGGKVNHDLFWQLVQALMVCNSTRIDCRIRTNEFRNAITVALGVSESYEKLLGQITPMSFGSVSVNSKQSVEAVKDIMDAAATKPYLLDYLHSQRVDGPSYLERLETEEDRPLLMLKVA